MHCQVLDFHKLKGLSREAMQRTPSIYILANWVVMALATGATTSRSLTGLYTIACQSRRSEMAMDQVKTLHDGPRSIEISNIPRHGKRTSALNISKPVARPSISTTPRK